MTRIHYASLSILLFAYACGGSPSDSGDTSPAAVTTTETGTEAQQSSATSSSGGGGTSSSSKPAATNAGSAATEPDASEAGAGGEAGAVAVDPIAPVIVPPECGDGHVDDGELCDDGNDVVGDGCNADCVPSFHNRLMATLSKAYEQQLFALTLTNGYVYGVGGSAESSDGKAPFDRLIVSLDTSDPNAAVVGTIDGTALVDDHLTGVTSDGYYLYTSGCNAPGATVDGVVERRSLSGSLNWSRAFAGSGNSGDLMTGVALVGGNLHASGYLYNSGSGLDATYGLLSKSNSKAPVMASNATAYSDFAYAIAPLGTGSVVTGLEGKAGSHKVWLRRLDASGATVWTKTLDTVGVPYAIATGADERIVVAGYITNTDDDSWFATFDGNGDFHKVKTTDHGGDDRATGVVIDPNTGDLLFSGVTTNADNGSKDFYLQRFTWDAAIVWYQAFDIAGKNDEAHGLAIDDDGDLWSVGSHTDKSGETDAWIGRFAP